MDEVEDFFGGGELGVCQHTCHEAREFACTVCDDVRVVPLVCVYVMLCYVCMYVCVFTVWMMSDWVDGEVVLCVAGVMLTVVEMGRFNVE